MMLKLLLYCVALIVAVLAGFTFIGLWLVRWLNSLGRPERKG